MKLSIVIPVFNEELNIGACLKGIIAADRGDYEIIVVDGGSTDATCQIVKAYSTVRLIASQKGRGYQMNVGAQSARGQWLLFLHADTIVSNADLAKFIEIISTSDIEAGCFTHHFDSYHPWMLMVSLIHNLRFHITNIIYGDQCLFLKRDLFLKLGGFAEGKVMEDIEFSERLIKETVPRRLPVKSVTSARKFRAIGIYRATFRIFVLWAAYARKKDARNDLFFSDIR